MNEKNVNQTESIKTIKHGDEIIKVCSEDIHKILNRVLKTTYKEVSSMMDVFSNLRTEEIENGKTRILVKGIGVSKPCNGDVFDEELGNNIAFMKAKLNANIKKHNILCRMYNHILGILDTIDEDLYKIDDYIKMDLRNLREHNSEYLIGLEDKLGIE